MNSYSNLLIFHNKKLIYASPEAFCIFGDEAFKLKDKSFEDLFEKEQLEIINSLEQNEETLLSINAINGSKLRCKISKFQTKSNEFLCIYFRANRKELVYRSETKNSGIYQEVADKYLSDLFSILDTMENSTNKPFIAQIKKISFAFSLEIHELLKAKYDDSIQAFDSTFVHFDFPGFIESSIEGFKREYKNISFVIIPKKNLPFSINANQVALHDFLKKCITHISKNGNCIYFEIIMKSDTISLGISGSNGLRKFFEPCKRSSNKSPEKINVLLELNELAKKSGARFTCSEYENNVDYFRLTYKMSLRNKIYEPDTNSSYKN